jgi:hypothetical protein
MEAMEDMLQRRKSAISCALVGGTCANNPRLNEAERLREKGGTKTVAPIK